MTSVLTTLLTTLSGRKQVHEMGPHPAAHRGLEEVPRWPQEPSKSEQGAASSTCATATPWCEAFRSWVGCWRNASIRSQFLFPAGLPRRKPWPAVQLAHLHPAPPHNGGPEKSRSKPRGPPLTCSTKYGPMQNPERRPELQKPRPRRVAYSHRRCATSAGRSA